MNYTLMTGRSGHPPESGGGFPDGEHSRRCRSTCRPSEPAGHEHSARSPCTCLESWEAADLDQQREDHRPLNF